MKVLFVCKANFFRSQAAESFFNRYTNDHNADSAGIEAEKYSGKMIGEQILTLYPKAKNILEKFSFARGIMDRRPKQLTKNMAEEFDKIVLLLEKEDKWPDYLIDNDKVIFWEVEDGATKDRKLQPYPKILKIVNQIDRLVKELISTM